LTEKREEVMEGEEGRVLCCGDFLRLLNMGH
jgi:hypothetical protein